MNQPNPDPRSSGMGSVRSASGLQAQPQPPGNQPQGYRQVRRKPRRSGWRRQPILIGLVALLVLATVLVAALKSSDLFAASMSRWMPDWMVDLIAADPTGTAMTGKSGGTIGKTQGASGQAGLETFKDGKLIVVLDAGHGGSDSGAIATRTDGKTIYESHLVLTLTKLVASRLEKAGIEVVMTRDSDDWVSLYNRISQASLLSLDCLAGQKAVAMPSASRLATMRESLQVPIRINSDTRESGGLGFMAGYGVGELQRSLLDLQKSCDQLLFVSIHGNSSTNRGLHGTQVYYCDDDIVAKDEAEPLAAQTSPAGNRLYANRNDGRNRLLATRIYDAIVAELPALGETNVGKTVLSGNYAVLREQALASVLIETGFMSHAGDLAILLDADSQQRLASAIARGIEDYARERGIGNLK